MERNLRFKEITTISAIVLLGLWIVKNYLTTFPIEYYYPLLLIETLLAVTAVGSFIVGMLLREERGNFVWLFFGLTMYPAVVTILQLVFSKA